MAQGRKPRHSRSTRKPVTIDLEPEAVSEQKTDDRKYRAETRQDAPESAAAGPASKQPASGATTAGPARDKHDTASAAGSATAEAASSAKATETATGEKSGASPDDGKDKKAASADRTSAAAETKKTTDGRTQPPPSHGSGGVRAVAAGLAGAVIAIAALFGLQWSGVVSAPGNADLVSKIISSDIDALKESIASLESAETIDTSGLTDALQERVEALEKTAALSADGAGSALSALETRLGELRSRVEDLSGSGQGSTASDLSDRVTALQTAHTGQQADLEKLQSSVEVLSGTVATDEARQEQALKDLEARLASIEKSLSTPREDIRVARALAAANLKAAIDRGGAFMAELEAFASVDGDSEATKQLRSLAAKGVPTRSALLNEFPSQATAMIDAARGSSNETGWVGRLMNSASSLVQVRPVGEVSGDRVEAIVARMETKLGNGDLQGALDEWKTLPEASQKVSESYAKDLQARILVDKLVAGTVNAALPTEATTGGSTDTLQTGGTN